MQSKGRLYSCIPDETRWQAYKTADPNDAENYLKPKTATASFRLDKSALNAIQDDARKQNVSVNTLLNQLVLAYANYDRPMKRFHMIKVPASSFKHILEAATSEAVIEAGNSAGKDVPNTYIRAKWGELTVENALNYLKTTAAYTNLFEYSEVVRGRKGQRHPYARFRCQRKPVSARVCTGDLRATGKAAEIPA